MGRWRSDQNLSWRNKYDRYQNRARGRQFTNIGEIDESWINQQINGLRRDEHPVCVLVTIKVFEMWNDERLNGNDITGGHVVAFFKRIRKISSFVASSSFNKTVFPCKLSVKRAKKRFPRT
jgi:hypothetical protein